MRLSPGQARVVDPVLSNHARGYKNGTLIATSLFPYVTMPTRAAKRIEFGKEAFRKQNTRRAPGAQIKRIQFGYEGKPVALQQHAIAAQTPEEHVEEAEAGPGIPLQRVAVDLVADVVELQLEIASAELARDAANYGANNKLALAGATQWSDPGSDPKSNIDDGSEQIRKATGKKPNTLILGAAVRKALRRHPDIKDHFKYVVEPNISDEMLARFFDIENVISGDAIYTEDDVTMSDVWGNDAILAYVAPAQTAQMGLPSYGYTYRLANYPVVAPVRWDPDTRSWVNDYVNEWSPEIVGPDAGFLFQSAAA